MNIYLKLPLTFDPAKLSADLQICESMQWTPHFHTEDYSGEWSSISLRSASGNAADIFSHPGLKTYSDTPLLQACLYFSEILQGFQCEKESVRLLRLAADAHIKEHTDLHTGYQYDIFRIHIPIRTSPDVRFLVGGHALDMRDGECWYADFSQPHSVDNFGTAARVNLIMDCKRNAWSDRLFAEAGYDFDAEARSKRMKPAMRAQVIAQLSEMNTETAHQLIRQLQAEAELDE